MVGLKHRLAILIAGMAIHSHPLFACVILPPQCVSEVNGRESQLMSGIPSTGDVVIFVERDGKRDSWAKLFLVDCKTRQGVLASLPKDTDFSSPILNQSVDYLIGAASSEQSYTLAEIRDRLRSEGLTARLSRLPEGHCGCTLVYEPVGCPEWSSG